MPEPAKPDPKPADEPKKPPAVKPAPEPPPLVEYVMAPTDNRHATKTQLPGVGLVDFALGPIPVRRVKPAQKDDPIRLPEKAKPHPVRAITVGPAGLARWVQSGGVRVAKATTATTVTKPNHARPGRHAKPVVRSYKWPGKRTEDNDKPEPKTVFFEILPLRALRWRND